MILPSLRRYSFKWGMRKFPIHERISATSIWNFIPSGSMENRSIVELLAEKPNLTRYEELYKHLHSHPELSLQEEQTAATIASHLESLNAGYKLHTSIGGHGLAGVLANGSGKTVGQISNVSLLNLNLPFRSCSGLILTPFLSSNRLVHRMLRKRQ